MEEPTQGNSRRYGLKGKRVLRRRDFLSISAAGAAGTPLAADALQEGENTHPGLPPTIFLVTIDTGFDCALDDSGATDDLEIQLFINAALAKGDY